MRRSPRPGYPFVPLSHRQLAILLSGIVGITSEVSVTSTAGGKWATIGVSASIDPLAAQQHAKHTSQRNNDAFRRIFFTRSF